MSSIDKDNNPFFSVIISAYNRAEYLPRALASLLNQTCKNWEVIISDDGSKDETYRVVNRFLPLNINISYLLHENRGPGFTKNEGIKAAAGEYITFLDSDDEYKPDHLESRKMILLANPEIDLLHGGAKIVGNQYVPDMNDPAKLIHLKNCVVGGTFFIKNKLAESLGYPDLFYGDDRVFFEKAQSKGLMIVNINKFNDNKHLETYIYHRDHTNSLCNNQTEKMGSKER